jgi:hypothetical protein
MRPMGPGGFNQRPAPYDRGDRFGGMNRYNSIGRGSRSFKGKFVLVNKVTVFLMLLLIQCKMVTPSIVPPPSGRYVRCWVRWLSQL